MKKNTDPLQKETYYHIYNRGINGENIFKEEKNYNYFLQKYAHYVSPFVYTFAYCMLKNHFHLLIRTHSESEILAELKILDKNIYFKKQKIENQNPVAIFSSAFSIFFKNYSQAINKAHNRTGRLFEQSFRRIKVDKESYFSELIYYIHHNPQKYKFVLDFRNYPDSSYHAHLQNKSTKLKKDEVFSWFGNQQQYEQFHLTNNEYL